MTLCAQFLDDDDDDETFRTSPAARGESQTKETQLDTSRPQADPESIWAKNKLFATWEFLPHDLAG